MWRAEDSQGHESMKMKWELIPYTRGRVLEVGCGPARAFEHFLGVDAIDYRNAVGPNVICDARKLIFADEVFDAVFSSHTLEDLEDTVGALREWWRVLKPGGYLCLYLPHADLYPNVGEPGANTAHKHDFRPQDIVDAMHEAAPDWRLERDEVRDRDIVRNGKTVAGEYSFFQVYMKLPAGAGQTKAVHLKPAKTAAVVRLGAYGDALWASSVLPGLKAQGYHVTVYCEATGEEVLRHDPNIDRMIIQRDYQVANGELLEFWANERPKYSAWINFTEIVEEGLLPSRNGTRFWWDDDRRRAVFGARNYLEAYHDHAFVPYDFRQKFYPTPEERAKAKAKREAINGPCVVLAPSGGSLPKFWPHFEVFAMALAANGVHVTVMGDLRGYKMQDTERVHYVGKDWSIRDAFAFACEADVCVGVETGLLNAVAMEDNLKIVLLSHSTPDNLTKHWLNTIALTPDIDKAPCYPCHRLHFTWDYCHRDEGGAALCQASVSAEKVAQIVATYLEVEKERAAA